MEGEFLSLLGGKEDRYLEGFLQKVVHMGVHLLVVAVQRGIEMNPFYEDR